MVGSEGEILLQGGKVLRRVDICRSCGRHIVWYEGTENRNLMESRRRRRGRKKCFVCISQLMQAKYCIRYYKKGAVKCST